MEKGLCFKNPLKPVTLEQIIDKTANRQNGCKRTEQQKRFHNPPFAFVLDGVHFSIQSVNRFSKRQKDDGQRQLYNVVHTPLSLGLPEQRDTVDQY